MIIDLTSSAGDGHIAARVAGLLESRRGRSGHVLLRAVSALETLAHLSSWVVLTEEGQPVLSGPRPDVTTVEVDADSRLTVLALSSSRPSWADLRPWPGTSLTLLTFDVANEPHPTDAERSLALWMDSLPADADALHTLHPDQIDQDVKS